MFRQQMFRFTAMSDPGPSAEIRTAIGHFRIVPLPDVRFGS
jgi:hypothetical protein